MNAPEPTYFLGLLDYQWSAVGSLATAVAAGIALILPVALDLRTTQRGRAKDKERLAHVVDSASVAVHTLASALSDWCQGNRASFHKNAAWSVGIARRLEIYAQKDGLSDDAVDCCVSAAAALKLLIDAAAEDAGPEFCLESVRPLHTALTIAIHVNTRLKIVLSKESCKSRFHDDAVRSLRTAIKDMNEVLPGDHLQHQDAVKPTLDDEPPKRREDVGHRRETDSHAALDSPSRLTHVAAETASRG